LSHLEMMVGESEVTHADSIDGHSAWLAPLTGAGDMRHSSFTKRLATVRALMPLAPRIIRIVKMHRSDSLKAGRLLLTILSLDSQGGGRAHVELGRHAAARRLAIAPAVLCL
jgi:hypothetical protein